MRNHLLKNAVAAFALLTGVFSATAAPTELWMLGPAVSGNWSDAAGDVVNFTNEGNGVFTYTGALRANELIIMDNKSWDGTRYAPKIANTILGDQTVEVVTCQAGAAERDYHWIANRPGTWKLTVTFTTTDGVENVAIKAQRETKNPIPANLYMCGPATDAGWAAEDGIALTNKGNGVFTYTGHLNAGDMIFMDNQGWGGTRYAPKNNYSTLGDPTVDVLATEYGKEKEYHWITKDACNYKVTVTFVDNDDNATITAEKVQETAPIPENLYMVGPATAAGWDINNAIQMTNEGNGKFTYEGDLYRTNIIFITGKDWANVRYVPENGGSSLSDENKSIFISTDGGDSRHWMVDYAGTWNVTVNITNDGSDVAITAQRISGPSQVIPLGAASNQWNSADGNNSVIKATTPGVYVWEGAMPVDDDRHFKFISRTGEWNSNIDFYLPAETDATSSTNANCSIKNVELDQEYPVTTGWAGNGNLESYWCLPTTAQTDEMDEYKVTLNLNNNTIKFTKKISSGIGVTKANALNARFIGDALVVEGAGAGVSVYDIAGRLLATSAEGSLTVAGLPNGVYVVKTAETVVKLAK